MNIRVPHIPDYDTTVQLGSISCNTLTQKARAQLLAESTFTEGWLRRQAVSSFRAQGIGFTAPCLRFTAQGLGFRAHELRDGQLIAQQGCVRCRGGCGACGSKHHACMDT